MSADDHTEGDVHLQGKATPLMRVSFQATGGHDVEKGEAPQLAAVKTHTNMAGQALGQASSEKIEASSEASSDPNIFSGKLVRLNNGIERLSGLEARGIKRVLPEERHDGGKDGYVQMFLLWFSINLVALNIIVGLLGPSVFQLGWTDCVCISIFANTLAACGPAYTSTFSAESGNRTMIVGRFFMGYWPAKIASVLNVIMQTGWGVIGCIVAGQMLSAVNGHGMTITIGCVISAILMGIIAAFGIGLVQSWERYAFIPQLIACFTLIGSSGKYWDRSAISVGDAATITASRCSFFSLSFSSVVGFSAVASDFYVYFPVETSKSLTFCTTWSGIWTAVVFCDIIGIGIATAVPNVPKWQQASEISSGKLLLTAYDGLGGWGGFCVVVLALGSVTNNAPCLYAAANSIQILGRYAKMVPRWFWCIVITVTELVLAVAGRNRLYDVFEDFLPIMAYWVCPWLTVIVEEHVLFHLVRGVPFDWSAWEDKKQLPVGAAALIAWLGGWAGAIIGMNQAWWRGPIARKIGMEGGDVGEWLAIGFTCVVYPPLRYLELQEFGR